MFILGNDTNVNIKNEWVPEDGVKFKEELIRNLYSIKSRERWWGEMLPPIINNNLKLQMQPRKRLLRANRKPLDFFDEAAAVTSERSNVLDAIKNQNLYLKIVGIALEISRQAGVTPAALDELHTKLLAAKGLQEFPMLNQDKSKSINAPSQENKNVSYALSKKYVTPDEQLSFLSKMEKQVVQAQVKSHVIYALKSYIEKKKKTINDETSKQIVTRTSSFLEKSRAKSSHLKLRRNNFYGQTLRDIIGRLEPQKSVQYETLKKMSHLKTLWGHTFFSQADEQYCPVYNAIFDNTQKLIITGGEDGKIKLWSRDSGALLSTLQGHKDYINKICVSKDNKVILSAAQDGVRFFDLDNMNSLGGFEAQSIMDVGEVVSTTTQTSSVIFANNKKLFVLPFEIIRSQQGRKLDIYDFKVYNFGSKLNQTSTNTINLTITPEGFVFLGFTEGQIIIFDFNKLHEAKIDRDNSGSIGSMRQIQEFQLPIISSLNAHEGDVLEIKWNPFLSCFSTGAKKDGVCKIWEFKLSQPQKRPIVIKELKIPKYKMKRKKKMYNCNFGCWNSALTHLTCSFEEQEDGDENENRGDGEVLVYNAMKMQVTWQMSKTLDLSSIRAMDSHPFYPNIMVICDSYGKVIIADIFQNCIINLFEERAFHLSHPSFCLVPSECRFSQDGLTLLVATEYGNFSIYGYDVKDFYQIYPTEQLFANDYEEFQIDPKTYKPVLDVDAPIDINNLDSGELQNIRHHPYAHLDKINAVNFKKNIENKKEKSKHLNQYVFSLDQLKKLAERHEDFQRSIEIFRQNIQEIENKRMAILYEEKQLREGRLKQVIGQKLQKIKQVDQNVTMALLNNSTISSQNNFASLFSQNTQNEPSQDHQAQQNGTTTRRRGRRPGRHSNNAASRRNYAQFQQEDRDDDDAMQNQDHHQNGREDEESYHADAESEDEDVHSLEDQDGDDDFNSSNQSSDLYQNNRTRRRRRLARSTRNTRITRRNNFQQTVNSHRNENRRPARIELQELENDYERQFGRIRKRTFQDPQPQQVNQQNQQIQEQESKRQIRRVASRSISQIRSERHNCQLCLFKESIVACYYCQQKKYCDGCKNYRGKKMPLNNSYVCFQCLFNKNSSVENHKNVSFQKYMMAARTDVFIPQIGDEVVYFFQGYEQFLSDKIQVLNNKYLESDPKMEIVPHENHPQLINIQKCEVIAIDYAFPVEEQLQLIYKNNSNRGRARLQKSNLQDILLFITLRTGNELEFKIFFTPGYEYLIKWQIYDDIMKNDRYGRFKLYEIAKVKSQPIQIEGVKPLNETYNNSIWKNIIVHKAESKYLRRTRDKSEDIAINIWSIEGYIDESAFRYRTSLSPATREHYRAHIARLEQSEPGLWQIFSQPVDIDIYPEYHAYVEVGMYLQLILERLRNNYYASERSLIADVKLLSQNSINFNGKDSYVTTLAEKLVRIILQDEDANAANELEIETEKKTKTRRKFNSGSSVNKDEDAEGRAGTRKPEVRVSKFDDSHEAPRTMQRLRKPRYAQKDEDDDYQEISSEENYDDDAESSEIKPVSRNKRRDLNHASKKQEVSNHRMTRSRNKN